MIRFVVIVGCFFGLLWAEGVKISPHQNLALACTACHSPASDSWHTIQFDHPQTGYTLAGAHLNTDCLNCHSVSDFSKVESDCQYCHSDVHKGRLTTECERCHTNTRNWSVLDTYAIHSETGFQLLGSHARLDCFGCHRGELENRFIIAESTCNGCHQTSYMSTTAPDHHALGLSRACNECHAFTGWKPARFRAHDAYFPINSGAHSGVWDDCTTCHKVADDYTEFSCTHCHAHRQSKMDDKHREKRDYVYESHACLSCHRNGKED